MSESNFEQSSVNTETGFATRGDFVRLEGKVDKLVDAMAKLVLFEERQSVQGSEMRELRTEFEEYRRAQDTKLEVHKEAYAKYKETIELRFVALEKKVDRWIAYFTAAWFVAVGAISVYSTFFKH